MLLQLAVSYVLADKYKSNDLTTWPKPAAAPENILLHCKFILYYIKPYPCRQFLNYDYDYNYIYFVP